MKTYKNRNLIWFILSFFLISSQAVAQAGWNWPEDKSTAQSNYVRYKDLMKQKNFEQALEPLGWLQQNAPNLNAAIWIDGAKVYEELFDQAQGEQKMAYADSTLAMYDKRMQHFPGDSVDVMNRKAISAAKFFIRERSKYDQLYQIFNEALKVTGQEYGYYNLSPHLLVAKQQLSQKKIDEDQFLNLYDSLSQVIEQNADNEKYRENAEKIDGILISAINVDCNFIQTKLVPQMQKDPSNIKVAKKIISLSIASKCTEQDYFTEAAMAVYEAEPNAGLAKVLGQRMAQAKNYAEAKKFLNSAVQSTNDPAQKSEILLGLAQIAVQEGDKMQARKYALEAAESHDSAQKEAYNLIGNLYFGSFEDCKKGQDPVEDRAVFILAYDMYNQAGNQEGMQRSRSQFPSKEEVFTYNKRVGDNISVDCWIQQQTKIRTRD